jgi:hypothetical protein
MLALGRVDMDREDACKNRLEAMTQFQIDGQLMREEPYGHGHINDTFLLTFLQRDENILRVILQRMNHEVFKNPAQLMENIWNVTSFLKKKIMELGGDPKRETLHVIETKDGSSFYVDSSGYYWRAYLFVEDTTSFDTVQSPEDFYESGVAFGKFQNMLSEYPAETLHETIIGFHDTKARFQKFQEVVKADPMGRGALVKKEIEFVKERSKIAEILGRMQACGELPLRVTHNDTKLNNVLLDNKTRKAICVIDLDTVMPGLAVNDFGDSIRFGASTGAEDERDLSKIECDLQLFEFYTKGFIEGCKGKLTKKELEMLPMGAKVMTFECGMRFLTDYLEGDVYFKIHREGQNLDRCRTQLKLVADMEKKWEELKDIVNKYK